MQIMALPGPAIATTVALALRFPYRLTLAILSCSGLLTSAARSCDRTRNAAALIFNSFQDIALWRSIAPKLHFGEC
jgi:hypothetical protein